MPDPHSRSRDMQARMTLDSRPSLPGNSQRHASDSRSSNRHDSNPQKWRNKAGGGDPSGNRAIPRKHQSIAPKPSASQPQPARKHVFSLLDRPRATIPAPSPKPIDNTNYPHSTSSATLFAFPQEAGPSRGTNTGKHHNIAQRHAEASLNNTQQRSPPGSTKPRTAPVTRYRSARFAHGRWHGDIERFMIIWEARRPDPTSLNKPLKGFRHIQEEFFPHDTHHAVKAAHRRESKRLYHEWCKRHDATGTSTLEDVQEAAVRAFLRQLLTEEKTKKSTPQIELDMSCQLPGPAAYSDAGFSTPVGERLPNPGENPGQTTLDVHGFSISQSGMSSDAVYTRDGHDSCRAASGSSHPRRPQLIATPSSDAIKYSELDTLGQASSLQWNEGVSEASDDEFPMTGSEADVLGEAAMHDENQSVVPTSSTTADLSAARVLAPAGGSSQSLGNGRKLLTSCQSDIVCADTPEATVQLQRSSSPASRLSSSPPQQVKRPSGWENSPSAVGSYDLMTPCPAAVVQRSWRSTVDEEVVTHTKMAGQSLPTPRQTSPAAHSQSTQGRRCMEKVWCGSRERLKAETGPDGSAHASAEAVSFKAMLRVQALEAELNRLKTRLELQSMPERGPLKRLREEDDVVRHPIPFNKRQRWDAAHPTSGPYQHCTVIPASVYSSSGGDEQLPVYQTPVVEPSNLTSSPQTLRIRNGWTPSSPHGLDNHILAGLAGSACSLQPSKTTAQELDPPSSSSFATALLGFLGSISMTLRSWFPSE